MLFAVHRPWLPPFRDTGDAWLSVQQESGPAEPEEWPTAAGFWGWWSGPGSGPRRPPAGPQLSLLPALPFPAPAT